MITETEKVVYSDYSDWKPEDYLTEYYSELMPDEQFAMEFLADWADKTPYAPIAVEFGCGPTVHHLFPIAHVAGEIHMAEYLASNRQAVQDWVDRKASAHNWDEFAKETLRLRGEDSPTPAQIERVQDDARQRITAIIPGNAFDTDPLGPARRGSYPLVMSHYCAEAASTDIGKWYDSMRNILSLAAPGGTVILSACGAANYYCVGGRNFPCAGVTPSDMLKSLMDNGFGDLDLRIRLVPAHTEQGYSSVIFARAVRRA
ncbi:hypothetical protein CCAX7_39540 [Capsulimonas corticalis]|uniref:Uncharacterized protein n=1 Tax=Capsulimonas corticalis TaxID=2219043 RepID=A0A402D3F6_9BACT|nr:guanitoxin biosynthesis pre-guanitoxin forming N-methyltransferase GntF [Capsulimonas corticalis]BDI31903.1 hypothetical protein CCAX7_39540 [Capsulimonas corticalis]